jgi:hypothetical protein
MKTAGSFLEKKTRTGGSLIPNFSKTGGSKEKSK